LEAEMKFATIPHRNPKQREGQVVLVSKDLTQAFTPPANLGVTLREVLENWKSVHGELEQLSHDLNQSKVSGAFDLDFKRCLAPLPLASGFYDGSAFLSHVVRARRARGDQMPESAKKTPLMYQGVSDHSLPWNAPLEVIDPAYGGDFEGEIAAVMLDTPRGTSPDKAANYIGLFVLFNDITLREIVKTEIETKFGFLQSKPNSSYAPIAITPDEMGNLWDGKRFLGDIEARLNGQLFGKVSGKEMHFTMGDLIAHACRTRPLSASSIVGTGTISNEDASRGFVCLTEKRFQEVIDTGKPSTPWLKAGDRVQIEIFKEGKTLFGPIDQTTV